MHTRWKLRSSKSSIGDAEKEQMKNDLAVQAAVDLIADAAVEVEAQKE